MLRSGGVRRNERQVDIGGCRAAQFDLGLFSRFLQALGRDLVLFQVNAVFLLELFGNIVNDPLVEVITAKARIAVGAQHFKHAVADVQNAHVEGAAAQVVYQNLLVLFLVKSVSQRSRRRLVDDTKHFQSGNPAGVFGRLPLAVIEVRGNRNDRLSHFLAEVAFGGFLHLGQDHRADILRRVLFAVDVYLVSGTHFTLDGNHCPFRIGHRLAFCNLADQPFPVFCERNDRRRCPASFRIGDNGGLSALHHGHTAVGGSQVNTDNLAHNNPSVLSSSAEVVFLLLIPFLSGALSSAPFYIRKRLCVIPALL